MSCGIHVGMLQAWEQADEDGQELQDGTTLLALLNSKDQGPGHRCCGCHHVPLGVGHHFRGLWIGFVDQVLLDHGA